MGDDELAVLILSGWSDGPLPALEHSLRQRGIRCVRVPLPMPPCGVYWCANPFLLLLAGVVWLMIYALNEVTLEPAALYIVLIIAGALVAARLCVAGVVRFAGWHGAANARRGVHSTSWRASRGRWSSCSSVGGRTETVARPRGIRSGRGTRSSRRCGGILWCRRPARKTRVCDGWARVQTTLYTSV